MKPQAFDPSSADVSPALILGEYLDSEPGVPWAFPPVFMVDTPVLTKDELALPFMPAPIPSCSELTPLSSHIQSCTDPVGSALK